MTPDTLSQTVLFPELFRNPLVATFDREHASSDGGAVLLKAAERVYGLVKTFCPVSRRPDADGMQCDAETLEETGKRQWQDCP